MVQTDAFVSINSSVSISILGHRDIIAALLNKSSLDPNLPDGLFGNTALIDASHAGNTDVVRQLLDDKRLTSLHNTYQVSQKTLLSEVISFSLRSVFWDTL